MLGEGALMFSSHLFLKDELTLHRLQSGWLFLFSVLFAAGLLFTMVFFVSVVRFHPICGWLTILAFNKIIMFSDLECDYINPIDLCNKLNQVFQIPLLPLDSSSYVIVRSARKWRPCSPHRAFSSLWPMDSFFPQRTSCRLQR
jgi:hypothetical protein